MPVSEAQRIANRKNALLSTGPRSPEGKDRSRLNAMKHGLTAETLPLSDNDAAVVASRFRDLEAEYQPTGTAGRLHLRRFAFLSLRLENSEKLHLAVYDRRVRHAEEEFDDHRLSIVEALASRVDADPATAVRRLQGMPEGIDWLLARWSRLRDDLTNLERDAWTQNHSLRVERLLGRPQDLVHQPRSVALREAMSGFFDNINSSEIVGLTDLEKPGWARSQLINIIDAEIERLTVVRKALDNGKVEQDRREARDRCLFDIQPSMDRFRKYEAATERSMYRAMKEFHQAEAESKATKANLQFDTLPTEMASFESQLQPETTGPKAIRQPTPRTLPPSPQVPKAIHLTGKKSLDSTPTHFGFEQNGLC